MSKILGSAFSWPQRCNKKAPIWVSAHSPISRFDIDKTVQLFKKYEEAGVALLTTGEIILDCLDNTMVGPVIRIKAHRNETGTPMGFSLLGPAEPNLLPASVGIDLCKKATKTCQRPIVANIGCFSLSTNENYTTILQHTTDNLKRLIDTGISAFEVALSCPTLPQQKNNEGWWEETFRLIKIIRKCSSLPISLKIGYKNLKNIDLTKLFTLCNLYNVTQLTAIDGTKLICPPKVDDNAEIHFPFDNYPALCYAGTHGPWNRFLLYDSIVTLKHTKNQCSANNIKISAVGGIMSVKQVFEAMALGADSVQLSSILFWGGINKLKEIIAGVQKKLKHFNENMRNFEFKVDAGAKEGFERIYGQEYIYRLNELGVVSATNLEKCISCELCCNTPCLAREFKDGNPKVIEHLCSGCGWCKEICPIKAIYMKQCQQK